MKKKILLILPLVASSLFISCANNGNNNSQDSNSVTSSAPASSSNQISYQPAPTYNEDSISIHYNRQDGNYASWALWLWDPVANNGREYTFNGTDEYGAIACYPLSTFGTNIQSLGFIVKGLGNWTKDYDGDRFINLSDYVKDAQKSYHVYLKSKDATVYSSANGDVAAILTKAEFKSTTAVSVEGTQKIKKVSVYEGTTCLVENYVTPNKKVTVNLPQGTEADLNNSYSVKVVFENEKVAEKDVSVATLYKTDAFKNAYTYEGNDLGATYTTESTTFKVWSPISSSIKVRIYKSGTPKSVYTSLGDDTIAQEVTMTKGNKGVFEATINGDLAGKYYTYVVTNGKYQDREIVDPYAKSCGINGKRGMIVDFNSERAKPEGWDDVTPINYDRKELTVYETHVADVTSSASWGGTSENAKKFAGMYEEGTTYTDGTTTVKTGFDHIKELGVNAVQLIPVFDQDNEEKKVTFNWGYNPVNYNCIEGGYSSDAKDGYVRIKEFRTLVQKYNQANINIIMDVVYNHVSSANGSNFDVLMPNYYFRYTETGDLSNGSGCGNETASELPMMRKFMKDSVRFLAETYKLGGFRFDLMGLHDVETMKQLTEEAKTVNPNIVIYGEPWQGGTSPLSESECAKQDNGNKYVGFGQFNDQMRDALIKGGLNSASAKGWITDNKTAISEADAERIVLGIKGVTKSSTVTINDPNKTVNYVTCHDNYTLYDRVKAAGIKDEAVIKKMVTLADSVVFTSQGTTFMLAGDEFLRTKGGDSNSYTSSYKVNQLDYTLKVKNPDTFANFQKLIAAKQDISGLHLGSGENLSENVVMNADKNMISYTVTDVATSRTYKIVHVNGLEKGTLTEDFDGYTLYLDTVNPTKTLSANTSLEAYETIIAYK